MRTMTPIQIAIQDLKAHGAADIQLYTEKTGKHTVYYKLGDDDYKTTYDRNGKIIQADIIKTS